MSEVTLHENCLEWKGTVLGFSWFICFYLLIIIVTLLHPRYHCLLECVSDLITQHIIQFLVFKLGVLFLMWPSAVTHKNFKFKNLFAFYFLKELCVQNKLKFRPLTLTYFRKLAECSGDRISVYTQLDSGQMDIEVPHIMLELFPKEAYTGGEWISDYFSDVILFIFSSTVYFFSENKTLSTCLFPLIYLYTNIHSSITHTVLVLLTASLNNTLHCSVTLSVLRLNVLLCSLVGLLNSYCFCRLDGGLPSCDSAVHGDGVVAVYNVPTDSYRWREGKQD